MRGLLACVPCLLLCTMAPVAAVSTDDLEGYWEINRPASGGLPAADICLRFNKLTASAEAKFVESRKLAWTDPDSKSATITLSGTVKVKALEGTAYPEYPNGELNFTSTRAQFRYGEPTSEIQTFQTQAATMSSVDANGTQRDYQRVCLYAFGGEEMDDIDILRITCLPTNDPHAGINAVLGFGAPPQADYPMVIETSTVKPEVFQRDKTKRCLRHGIKQGHFGNCILPSMTGYRLWIELAATFSTFSTSDLNRVLKDVSEYLKVPLGQLNHITTSPGSVVLQILVSGYPEGSQELESRLDQMISEIQEGVLTLGGYVVLIVYYIWYNYIPPPKASDSLPAWSVIIMILSTLVFLCWMGYTLQCRTMVLKMEKEYTEGKGKKYQRVSEQRAHDKHDYSYNPVSTEHR